jgi:hypothetical protein
VLFDRIWAAEMLERAIAATEAYYAGRGRPQWFEAMRPLIDGAHPGCSRVHIADGLGFSPRKLTMELHHLRQRIAANLYREVLRTVQGVESAHEEMNVLKDLLRW